jgi:hypothetical protein
MNKVIIDFINEQESVYIVETKEMVLDSMDPNIGRQVLGTGRMGVIYEYCREFGIETWRNIEHYSLVSIVDYYSSDRIKIICVFDCKTLESTKIDLVIY